MQKSILYSIVLFFSLFTYADEMEIYVEKQINDNNIIITTPAGEHLQLEKLTMSLSSDLFEGETYLADVDSFFVKIGKMEWSIKQSIDRLDLTSRTKSTSTENKYEITIAYDDELFLINGKLFRSKTYCLAWDKGDKVKFIEGNALGTCVSAKLLNMNRNDEICELWCQ